MASKPKAPKAPPNPAIAQEKARRESLAISQADQQLSSSQGLSSTVNVGETELTKVDTTSLDYNKNLAAINKWRGKLGKAAIDIDGLEKKDGTQSDIVKKELLTKGIQGALSGGTVTSPGPDSFKALGDWRDSKKAERHADRIKKRIKGLEKKQTAEGKVEAKAAAFRNRIVDLRDRTKTRLGETKT
jgi:hypothetical protein